MENNTFSYKRLDKVSVKVQIGGKEYPMTVNSSDEQKVLQAAAILEEQMTKYKTSFNIIEKQDLLAIVAFDAVFEKLTQQEKQDQLVEEVSEELERITHQLSS